MLLVANITRDFWYKDNSGKMIRGNAVAHKNEPSVFDKSIFKDKKEYQRLKNIETIKRPLFKEMSLVDILKNYPEHNTLISELDKTESGKVILGKFQDYKDKKPEEKQEEEVKLKSLSIEELRTLYVNKFKVDVPKSIKNKAESIIKKLEN